MRELKYIVITLLGICLSSCLNPSQNLNEEGKDKFKALEVASIPEKLPHFDTTYVAIYSDIYSENKDTRFNLTATLSLRNTSLKHSIYITAVDYYDTWGENIKSYLVTPVKLKPMQSVEYVIDETDTDGGTGANFVIYWGSESTLVEPIFEGIMISTNGQQGISFSTKGISISNK